MARPSLRWTVAVVAAALLATVAPTRPAGAQAAGSAPAGGTCAFVKPPVLGLVDRRGEPLGDGEAEPADPLPTGGRPFRFPGQPGYDDAVSPWVTAGGIDGFVVQLTWAELQPTPYGPLAEGNQLDKAIARVARIKELTGLDVGLRVRLYAGIWSPDWVKALDPVDPALTVAPVTIFDPANPTVPLTLPRYWSATFAQAYDDLLTKVAARYDTSCAVRELTLTRCTTIFGEPFVREADAPNADNLHAAGYTDALDRQCLRDQVAPFRHFRYTRAYLATNPYLGIRDTKPFVYNDVALTVSMIDACRAELGERCVVANNSIRFNRILPGGVDPNVDWNGSYLAQGGTTATYRTLYQAHKARGGPLAYQTAEVSRIQSLPNTILFASEELGGGSVELPFAYAGPSRSTVGLPFEGFDTLAGFTAAANTGAVVRGGDPASLRTAALELDARLEERAPGQPTDVVATVSGPGSVTVTWTAGSGAGAHRVLRDGQQVSGDVTGASFTDDGLPLGRRYSYAVLATNAAGSTWPAAAAPVAVPPAVPTGLTAAAVEGDGTRATLSWAPAEGAVGYQVTRNGALVSTGVTATQFADAGLTPGTVVTYRVVAEGDGAVSAASDPAVVTTVLGPVLGLTAKPKGTTSVTLTWSALAGATGYDVLRDGVVRATTSATVRTFVDVALPPGTTATWVVAARNPGGRGASSAPVSLTTAPAAPTSAVATAVAGDPTALVLTWAPVTGAASYQVARTGAATLSVTTAQATVTGLAANTSYTLTVRAVGSTGLLGPTTTVKGRTVPAAPAGLTVARLTTPTSLRVAWSAVSGASAYEVWRDGVLVTTTTGRTFTDAGLARSTTFTYSVRATSAVGPGPFATATGTTL